MGRNLALDRGNRRAFIALIGGAVIWPALGRAAEPGKVHRVGFLGNSTAALEANLIGPFRDGLRELGYEEGRSIMVEYRYPLGRLNQMPSLIEELIRLKVNVLVVGPQSAISAAKKITKTTPIVMISSIDPVAAGHIARETLNKSSEVW